MPSVGPLAHPLELGRERGTVCADDGIVGQTPGEDLGVF